MKEEIVDVLEKALFDLVGDDEKDTEKQRIIRINIVARLKSIIRDIKRYL